MKLYPKRFVYDIIVVGLLVAGIVYICSRFVHLGNVEYTDNAQVQQHITSVNTRVQGFLREVRFDEYQRVHRGDTLAIIEDAEFRLALAQAEANLANAQASGKATSVSIATVTNNLGVNDATIEEVRVQRDNARRELERYEALYAQQAVTRQQYDQVLTAYQSVSARFDQVSRARQSASLAVSEQTHRLTQSEAGIRLAEAAVNMARLNLSYTVIVATADGVLGAKDVHVGQLVQPGMTIVDIVDDSEKWVVANYRESQLPHISVGCEVDITADAVPGVHFRGVVERISGATGSAYSIVPTDNATGNFVKVEQRVPVRISLSSNDPESLDRLRAGLNVECEAMY
ncbi:MAG: HlyD family secretion protein [Bacteroidales bacterium]|nr:HlyD family secretion protein [Bacteroidales bacterium]